MGSPPLNLGVQGGESSVSMLSTTLAESIGRQVPNCDNCHRRSTIAMVGYSEHGFNLCSDCALQLVRVLTEDLCELLTRGGRHG